MLTHLRLHFGAVEHLGQQNCDALLSATAQIHTPETKEKGGINS